MRLCGTLRARVENFFDISLTTAPETGQALPDMNANTPAKKITAATFKAFVAKNRAALHIAVNSSFDGMIDGCVSGSGIFKPAVAREQSGPFQVTSEAFDKHTHGIRGIWLVGRSRDYFAAYNKNGFTGIEVSNSCGCFIVAIPTA